MDKALGLYSCPIRILKSSSRLVFKPPILIMNSSIETGIYPSKLKHV